VTRFNVQGKSQLCMEYFQMGNGCRGRANTTLLCELYTTIANGRKTSTWAAGSACIDLGATWARAISLESNWLSIILLKVSTLFKIPPYRHKIGMLSVKRKVGKKKFAPSSRNDVLYLSRTHTISRPCHAHFCITG